MAESVVTKVTGFLQNILADIVMLCGVVGLSGVPAVSKVFQRYIQIASLLHADNPESFQSPSIHWTSVYLSLSLAVTLLCTIFIEFRIVTLGRANRDAALGGYRSIIEIVVESAALLSIIVIIYMTTHARGAYASIYVDAIAASIRGIVLTLIVGRVASRHARPDDARKSVLSSLHFGTRNHAQTQANTQYSDEHDTISSIQDGNTDANE
ncbi:hypothetical protein ARMGADRAFT_1144779 [Armillaria gallica]|uniref:Uncharacterized protein n=1 Tax=Armillaria gallica TaxID=47427 RepID=A0A2H3DMK7_ARMGA|nr:hypothetical protein ARMGADRAFT_1144779 [Armillaria gallica]